VQLLESGSRLGFEIAHELGIARSQRDKWQTALRARGSGAFPGSGPSKERTTEIARLKRELARVTEDRDIVKNRPGTLPRNRRDVPVYLGTSAGGSTDVYVPCLAVSRRGPSPRTQINQALIEETIRETAGKCVVMKDSRSLSFPLQDGI
jgi:transposase